MALRQRPGKTGLYDPAFEHDSCGVGFVAHIKGQRSHEIIDNAREILVRMTHRGAVGAEKNTGDGAGLLCALPVDFLEKTARNALGLELGKLGTWAAGIFFLPQDATERALAKESTVTLARERGIEVLGWRPVPVCNTMIGPTALASEPAMEMAFVADRRARTQDDFERSLFVFRKQVTHRVRGQAGADPESFFYVASLSTRIMVYKGMLMPEQLFAYFPDLSDPDFKSHLAMVHSRFSTNTFPSWDRAQPLRYMSHNGEINTLRGNINKMRSRQGKLQSAQLGDELRQAFPVSEPDLSDSGHFDNVLELLIMNGRELPEAVMMMIPEAWQRHPTMAAEKRAMYEFFSNLMEPWDGPASVVFTDGKYIGATLDRNGLRPSRFYITDDDLVVMASEVGVLDIPEHRVVKKGRLQPGRMFLVDFEQGRIVDDEELKARYASAKPYGQWIAKQKITLESLPPAATPEHLDDEDLKSWHRLFGYTQETLKDMLKPMAESGSEPLGSMGNDAPLAVLSTRTRLVYDYFKQLFAQVTNPPIDSVRESVIMSLKSSIGPEANLLDATEAHAHRLVIEHPVLTNGQMASLKAMATGGWKTRVIDATFPRGELPTGSAAGGPEEQIMAQALQEALDRVCSEAEEAIAQGYTLAVLSDRASGKDRLPIPSLVAVGAVHQHLVRAEKRTQIGLVVETADAREVHHYCLLTGFGADAINPYLAFESIWHLLKDGQLAPGLDTDTVTKGYLKAIEYGMLKVFGKMGISTLESYKAAQIFEAVGLNSEVVARCFTGTASRIEGAGFAQLVREMLERHSIAWPRRNPPIGFDILSAGDYAVRWGAEKHMWDPESIASIQHAVRYNDQKAFDAFAARQNQRSVEQFTLRGLLSLKTQPEPIPLDQVEPAEAILKRFATGAMSFGSISQEAHETLAVAMNRIGGKSNTGEGGELSERYKPLPNGDSKRSAIKQVASGRFGVTNEYLANADEIQIKMAQGAKPGEGGELPGHKVFEVIAKTRHTTKGVGLISPPPHHDIYSIEDLAQLIFDLKNANPRARISVKLVSEVGVGTIAAGVAKAHADHILVSGHDGGTGASPLTGIKHAGLPWELGLAETHQTLVMNDLRSRVTIQTDGQLKTGRDVVIATMLGAEEYGFATSALIVIGCIMMRKCHKNTCPTGVATQDPALRAKFTGKPEHVVNFFRFIAEDTRKVMASLGVRTLEELVGRTDLLEADGAVRMWKSQGIDLAALLSPARIDLAPSGVTKRLAQDHGIDHVLDRTLIQRSQSAINHRFPQTLSFPIKNTDRSTGTMLSYEVALRHGLEGLPPGTLLVNFHGHAGQSFGGWLAKGIRFVLEGDANDYVGKGLSGGELVIRPVAEARFPAEENIIIGNVAFYGAISGRAFIRGMAAERFCVRNSGATVVIEGVGDHGCEYMTGGTAVILGPTGRNFAAGMSGGIAYVWDPSNTFASQINPGMVEVEAVSAPAEVAALKALVAEHRDLTGSSRAAAILDAWDAELPRFRKVISPAYRRILELEAQEAASQPGSTPGGATPSPARTAPGAAQPRPQEAR